MAADHRRERDPVTGRAGGLAGDHRSPSRRYPFDPMKPAAGDEIGLTADWSIPWSDLMMVMFVLFAVLFAYQAAERDLQPAFDQTAENEPLSTPGVFEQSLEAARQTNLDQVEVVIDEDRSVRLTVGGPMFFDLGKAELRPRTRGFLDRIAMIVARSEGGIRVVGHTDNFPISSDRFPTNWELSTARAAAVARYMIQRGSIDPQRFTVAGHSMYRPAASNTSPGNKALNRRVEIVIDGNAPQSSAGELL